MTTSIAMLENEFKPSRWVFPIIFMLGFASIVLLRTDLVFSNIDLNANQSALIATAIVCVLILGYCVYATKLGALNPDWLHQAADSSYFLGLLFTLTSLAISLLAVVNVGGGNIVDGGNSVVLDSQLMINLIPNFGIALFSTIIGLFGRIYLLQAIPIVPADEDVKNKLVQAAETLREAGQASNDYFVTLSSAAEEVLESVREQSEHMQTELRENFPLLREDFFDEISNALESKLTAQNTEIYDNLRESQRAFQTHADELNEHLTATATQHQSIAHELSILASDLNRANENSLDLSEISKAGHQIAQKLDGVNKNVDALSANLHHIQQTSDRAQKLYISRIKTMNDSTKMFDQVTARYLNKVAEVTQVISNKLKIKNEPRT